MRRFCAIPVWSGLLLSVAASPVRADFAPTAINTNSPKDTIIERRKEIEVFEARKLAARDQLYEQVTRDALVRTRFPWAIAGIFFAGLSIVLLLAWWRGRPKPQNVSAPSVHRPRGQRPTSAPPDSSDGAAAGALLTVLSMLKPSRKRRRHRHRHHHHHHSHRHRHDSESPGSSGENA